MVIPVVLAVGALALYFLSKPKSKSKNDTSDFNSKSVDKIISDSKYVKKKIDYNNINVKKALKKQKTKPDIKSTPTESKDYQKRISKSYEDMIR